MKKSPHEIVRRTRGRDTTVFSDMCIGITKTVVCPLLFQRLNAMLTPLINAAAGVRRAQRRPGRPMEKHDQHVRVEDQGEFGF